MKSQSFADLFETQLKDIYSAENQIIKALPRIIRNVSSGELKDALQEHLQQTHMHVQRLEEIFIDLRNKPKAKQCRGMKGLLDEGDEMLTQDFGPDVRDAGLIAAAQRIEHYEIASYGVARSFAEALGHERAASLLQATLNEEKKADELLTTIAERSVNIEARNSRSPIGRETRRGVLPQKKETAREDP